MAREDYETMTTAERHAALAEVMQAAGVSFRVDSRPTSHLDITTDADGWRHYAYTVTISYANGHLTAPFRMGTAHTTQKGLGRIKPVPPTALDAVQSLVIEGSALDESHADWCANYGYDEDSRKGLETYLTCQKHGHFIRKAFGQHYETVSDIVADY